MNYLHAFATPLVLLAELSGLSASCFGDAADPVDPPTTPDLHVEVGDMPRPPCRAAQGIVGDIKLCVDMDMPNATEGMILNAGMVGCGGWGVDGGRLKMKMPTAGSTLDCAFKLAPINLGTGNNSPRIIVLSSWSIPGPVIPAHNQFAALEEILPPGVVATFWTFKASSLPQQMLMADLPLQERGSFQGQLRVHAEAGNVVPEWSIDSIAVLTNSK